VLELSKFYPVLKPNKLPDGTLEEVPETRTGIVRLTIHQAKELDGSRTLSSTAINPFAKLFIGGQKEEAHRTGVFKSNFNPSVGFLLFFSLRTWDVTDSDPFLSPVDPGSPPTSSSSPTRTARS
jgi:hypothetical protein